MDKTIQKCVEKSFPELTGGLHLDRYARVVAIADAPNEGATCERFRPRYAVDIEILTPELEVDETFPRYTAVPLPVTLGCGQEKGMFAFPEPGALVVIGFAYGMPDHPIIRQVYPLGMSLPKVEAREFVMQPRVGVVQRADSQGNWSRTTDGDIRDVSVSRHVDALTSEVVLGSETRTVREHMIFEVGSTAQIEAGVLLALIGGVRLELGTLGQLNIMAGADGEVVVAGTLTGVVGGDRFDDIRGGLDVSVGSVRNVSVGGGDTLSVGSSRSVEVGGASSETVTGGKTISAANINLAASGMITLTGASGGVSVFGEMCSMFEDIRAALAVLATHTHSGVGACSQGGSLSGYATSVGGHNDALESVTG